MTHRSLSRRAVACVTTGALAVVASGALAGSASAATGSEPVHYSSTAGTAVLGLSLNLPDNPVTSAAGIPNPAELTLLGTNAAIFHGADASKDVATATSSLAGGSLVTSSPLSPLLSVLASSITSDLKSPGPKTGSPITVPANPLTLAATIGGQTADVSPTARTANAGGLVADASLGSLTSLGLGSTLQDALTQLNDALAMVLAQAAPLTDALSAIPALPSVSIPNPLAGVLPGQPATIDTPTIGGTTISDTISELPAQIKALEDKLLNGSVLDIKGIGSSESLTPTADNVSSSGKSSVGTINLFGGLVTVVATDASVSAVAARTAGAATSGGNATLLTVKVSDAFGDLLKLIADQDGITAGLLDGTLGQALDSTVKPTVQLVSSALNTVLAQLTSLLQSLNSGASLIQQGTVTKKVSADGHTAEAHATPASVTLGLPIAPNLITLSLGKVDTVSSLSVAEPVVVTPPTSPGTNLPRTGASEGAAAIALLLLLSAGGAVVVRRRHAVAE